MVFEEIVIEKTENSHAGDEVRTQDVHAPREKRIFFRSVEQAYLNWTTRVVVRDPPISPWCINTKGELTFF